MSEPPDPDPGTDPSLPTPPSGHQALDEWGQTHGLSVEQRGVVGSTIESGCAELRAGVGLGLVRARVVAALRLSIGSLADAAFLAGVGHICPDVA